MPRYIKKQIGKISAADVQELRHGRWERINPFIDTMTCSLCDYNIVSEEMKTPYCPWCGAKMDLEEEAQ